MEPAVTTMPEFPPRLSLLQVYRIHSILEARHDILFEILKSPICRHSRTSRYDILLPAWDDSSLGKSQMKVRSTAWFEMATFSKLHLVRNSELDPVWKNMSYLNLEHNCTIFLCSLDVRNIVQGGDPLYAGFFSTQGSGGYTWPKWVWFFAKNTCL